MHFFLGGCDWYCCEYNPEEQVFFGYAILNSDFHNAEWGYFPLAELCEIKAGGFIEVDRDLHFPPTKAGEIEKIRRDEEEESFDGKPSKLKNPSTIRYWGLFLHKKGEANIYKKGGFLFYQPSPKGKMEYDLALLYRYKLFRFISRVLETEGF